MNKLVAVFCLLLACLGTTFVAHAQSLTQPLDRIVAVVEDEVILQSELDHTVANILAQYRNNPQQLPPRNELERQVLDNLVLVHLQVQRAQSTGIRVTDAEIDQAMQRVAESNKIDVRQLRAQLEHDGLDYDDFRKTLRDQLLVQRLRQRVVQSQVNVTDSEVDILLASNSLKAGEVHLAHILVGVKDGASAEEIQAAKEKADSVKKQIDDGMDFSAAALRFSNAQDALQGGDLGWRRYDEVPEAFANLTEGMQPGQVSQVLRGPAHPDFG
jgi:peptidyl-prolyl cis-trans isomerase SurA